MPLSYGNALVAVAAVAMRDEPGQTEHEEYERHPCHSQADDVPDAGHCSPAGPLPAAGSAAWGRALRSGGRGAGFDARSLVVRGKLPAGPLSDRRPPAIPVVPGRMARGTPTAAVGITPVAPTSAGPWSPRTAEPAAAFRPRSAARTTTASSASGRLTMYRPPVAAVISSAEPLRRTHRPPRLLIEKFGRGLCRDDPGR